MIVDCHYHLETRMQSVENLIAKMDAAGIEKTALMATLWDVPPHTPEFLLKALRFFLYHRFLRPLAKRLGAKFSPDGDIVLPKATVKIYQDPDNAEVAAAMSDHPDRFLGWIFVNPRGRNNPVDEFEKWKEYAGFIGVKAHPFWHRYDPVALAPVAEKAAEAGMPLLIHVGFDSQGDYLSLMNAVPGLKLILAHAGFPEFADTWAAIQNMPNVYVDLSADAYVDADVTCHAVAALGADRCLFGTDGPYGHVADDGLFDNGFIKRRIEGLFQDPVVQKKLFSENFQKLIPEGR